MKVFLTENQAKYLLESLEEIDKLANKAETKPTEAQKKAGNYKMGHLKFAGFDISIENPKGSKRYWADENGKKGFNLMKNHYGYFVKTKGYDGDQVDVFLGPNEDFTTVYVVDQNNREKEFDESKVMLGFNSKKEAKKAYMSNFDKNWKGFRTITAVPKDIFKQWLYSGKKQRKPFSEYNLIKSNISEIREKINSLITEIESRNTNYQMTAAKSLKNDEFYTRTEDIAKELKNYSDEFAGKIVYCNCDDHNKSNFYKFFKDNFTSLGLRKLITSGINDDGKGVYGIFDGTNEKLGFLEGNGYFDSPESMKFLAQCDIVVSNPPFSLFRSYIDMLQKSGKKFLVLGNMNAIKYKEVFPLFKNNEMRTGYTGFNKGMYFNVPDNFEYSDNYHFKKEIDGQKVGRVSGISWFTNIETKTKNKNAIELSFSMKDFNYQKYDNYNAIDCPKVSMIPYDYDGYIGVPFTVMDKVSPDGLLHCSFNGNGITFKVIGLMNSGEKNEEVRIPGSKTGKPVINGKILFTKVILKKI